MNGITISNFLGENIKKSRTFLDVGNLNVSQLIKKAAEALASKNFFWENSERL